MRKELVVFIPTMERGEELSISSVTKDRDYIIITSPNGNRTTANLQELQGALKALVEFNSTDVTSESIEVPVTPDFNDVEYGND